MEVVLRHAVFWLPGLVAWQSSLTALTGAKPTPRAPTRITTSNISETRRRRKSTLDYRRGYFVPCSFLPGPKWQLKITHASHSIGVHCLECVMLFFYTSSVKEQPWSLDPDQTWSMWFKASTQNRFLFFMHLYETTAGNYLSDVNFKHVHFNQNDY